MSCVLVGTSQLGVVPHEFLFGTQPIVDVVSVLPATCLVQTECELRNLVVCRGRSTTGVLSHFHLTSHIRSDDVSDRAFVTSFVFLCCFTQR
jgi:hypothetical protein